MVAVAGACRRALIEADPRLVEACYLAQVQSGPEALSGVYAVLGRRRWVHKARGWAWQRGVRRVWRARDVAHNCSSPAQS